MKRGLDKFLSPDEQRAVVQSIKDAELRTSGEIRVHIEPKCPTALPMERAVQVFGELKMYETKERNAVLIYLAYKSRNFAIIGDKGINERVPADFWNCEKDTLATHLRAGNPCKGICKVIEQIGENLKNYFPHQDDDINEQSDEISYSE